MIDLEIFKQLNESVLLIDSEGHVIEANKAACSLLGIGREEILGRFCYNILGNQDIPGPEFCQAECPLIETSIQNKKFVSIHPYNRSNQILVLERVVTHLHSNAVLLLELNDIGRVFRLEDSIIHICSFCHKIRESDGKWVRIEEFFQHHLGISFSHGMCEECMQKHYPEFWEKRTGKKGNNSD